ncbi:MAG: arylsulfatase [Planctomycetota bacterium]
MLSMLRKTLIKICFVLCVCAAATASVAATNSGKPNILILYADDLGYGDLSCQNPDSKIPTPNLDDLAQTSMRFSDGHSSSGICTPSRYALLTGRYHWRKFHGIVNAFGDSVFDSQRLTMSEMLKTKGYSTAAIGKWHLGWNWESIRKPDAKPHATDRRNRNVWGPKAFNWTLPIADGPLAHGFDYYFGDTVINFPPYCWIENNLVTQVPDRMMDTKLWKPIKEGNWECRPGPMVDDWDPYENLPTLAARGEAYLHAQSAQEEPFFLFFAFPSPHAPIIPNDQFDGLSQAGAYGDFVCETDDVCGRLLRALEESRQADNTLVVFTADNGSERYAYRRDQRFDHWSSAPFRGLKRDIYEGGHHVPYLIRWPGVTEPGQVCNALVSQIDLMATFASVVGFELPDESAEDSFDLVPLLQGDVSSVRESHVHNTYANAYAIRSRNWLLVDRTDGYHSQRNAKWEKKHSYPPDDGSPAELYDLASDLGQRRNLASKHSDKVASLRAKLKILRGQGFSAPRLVAESRR